MQDTVEAPGDLKTSHDLKTYIVDDYVHLLFEQFKDTTFERILLMAFARDHDLAQIVLNNALPKGQRHFSESDVREFIARFHKQSMQLKFFLAKNAIIATGRPALALGDYETALHNLLREFSRCLGASLHHEGATSEDPEVVADEAPQPAVPPPPPPPPPPPQDVPQSAVQLLLDPLWSVMFPLPILLGWLANLRPWPLVGMALCSTITFTMAHGQRSWRAWARYGCIASLLHMAVLCPIALHDREGIHWPTLPYGGGLPSWVTAGLWGLICAMATHWLTNLWLLFTRKPPKSAHPGR
ncbi:MAG: hypothetical protein AB7N91_12035 [Candidatus Tectimicrobiota bacterium]